MSDGTNVASGPGRTTKALSRSVVLASDHDPVPVTIVGESIELDIDTTGLASGAKQDTGNTSLGSIDTKLTSQATAAKQDTAQTSLTSIDGRLTAQIGPNRNSGLYAIAMTTSSAHTTLAASDLLTDINAGKEFVVTAEGGDIWWYCSPNTSGHTVSATAASVSNGTTTADYIPSGQSTPPMTLPAGTQGIVALASSASALLRFRRVN